MTINEVGLAHLASVPAASLLVALVFTINVQGPRKAVANESVLRGTTRRFLKIVILLAYCMLVVEALTRASDAGPETTARTLYTGFALALTAPIGLYLAGTILLWIVGGIIGVDLEAKVGQMIAGRLGKAPEPEPEEASGK